MMITNKSNKSESTKTRARPSKRCSWVFSTSVVCMLQCFMTWLKQCRVCCVRWWLNCVVFQTAVSLQCHRGVQRVISGLQDWRVDTQTSRVKPNTFSPSCKVWISMVISASVRAVGANEESQTNITNGSSGFSSSDAFVSNAPMVKCAFKSSDGARAKRLFPSAGE